MIEELKRERDNEIECRRKGLPPANYHLDGHGILLFDGPWFEDLSMKAAEAGYKPSCRGDVNLEQHMRDCIRSAVDLDGGPVGSGQTSLRAALLHCLQCIGDAMAATGLEAPGMRIYRPLVHAGCGSNREGILESLLD